MHNLWLIARHEYRKIVHRKGFLIGIVGFPLLIIAVMGLSIFLSISEEDNRSVGYVDLAEIIVTSQNSEADIQIIGYADQAAARDALGAQEIQAYYVIPAGYPETRQIELYYWDDEPTEGTHEVFSAFVRKNLAAGMPEAMQTRLIEGSSMTVRSIDGSREVGEGNIVAILLPFVASFLFIFVVMTSASYLLQVVSDEKENRTIEILLTSLSPEQLIGGKALGLMAVALTQLVTWIITVVVVLLVAAQFFDWARMTGIPWDYAAIILLFFIPAFALIAGIMTAIGGSVTELRQGQQIAGLLNMIFILPLFFILPIMTNPDSPLVLFLTFFPTTSFLTMSLRWGMNIVPFWQLALSWIILVSSALVSVWASARIFRAGMLRYGQRLDLSAVMGALRGQKSTGYVR